MAAHRIIAFFASALALIPTAPASESYTPIPANFMLVLREVEGANKQTFGLEPSGTSTAALSSGETVTIDNAWYDLIGDMHVRFVMDGETSMANLTTEEFGSYGLTPEEAVAIAVANIKKTYGSPKSSPWQDGIMLVSGDSPDLDSSYFLDSEFWNKLLDKYPSGLIVGVPKRGGLVYAPVSDISAVLALERSIHSLYETSGNMRVSSGLYLYKAGAWSVFRAPRARPEAQ